jgi:hypothetical protein
MPASGRSAATLVRLARGGVKHRSFIGLRLPRRVEPSDTSLERQCLVRESLDPAPEAQSREPVPVGARQCADVPELEVPSTGEDLRKRPFERLRGALPPLACGGSRRTCSSTFENLD